jgi:hypothetical protein
VTDPLEQQRRVRRSAVLLAVLALGFYVMYFLVKMNG